MLERFLIDDIWSWSHLSSTFRYRDNFWVTSDPLGHKGKRMWK